MKPSEALVDFFIGGKSTYCKVLKEHSKMNYTIAIMNSTSEIKPSKYFLIPGS